MVVLEGGGGVVTIGNNQYLQPDYLTPLPTTLDAKKSPLALLAQTCSQIGADNSTVKPLLNMDKKKPETTSKSPSVKTPKSNTPNEVKLAYKPYEANVLSAAFCSTISSTKSEDYNNTLQQQQRPSSKSSASTISESVSSNDDIKSQKVMYNGCARVPSRNKSNSPEISVTNNSDGGGKSTPNDESGKAHSPSGSSQRGASPIIRSGLEVLQGHPKDLAGFAGAYKQGTVAAAYGLSPLSALCCPPGMEQHTNPAFRPPFAGGFSHHQAAMIAAAAANGYPGGAAAAAAAAAATANPYISYQRIKTASGSEAIVPVCKDPYCPGCPYSAHTQQMLMGAPCPSGCTQCEHQKYGLAMAASLGSLPPGHPYAAAAAAAAASAQMRSPYVCSWIAGDSYCGKRFNTSEELFSHLRTHTGNLSDPVTAAAAFAQSQTQSLLSSLFPQSAMQRGYPTPPLSPMSAARYHPYAKPGTMPTAIPGSQFALNPAAAAALGPYYSPYAMYGQRIGSAAVHP